MRILAVYGSEHGQAEKVVRRVAGALQARGHSLQLHRADRIPGSVAVQDFDAVLDSVKAAGLAGEVARLKARFVIKDADMSLRGAA